MGRGFAAFAKDLRRNSEMGSGAMGHSPKGPSTQLERYDSLFGNFKYTTIWYFGPFRIAVQSQGCLFYSLSVPTASHH